MRGRPKLYGDFSRGLNLKAGPRSLGPGETPDALNMSPDERGPAVKRLGDSNLWTLPAGTGISSLSATAVLDLGASLLFASTLEHGLYSRYPDIGGTVTSLGTIPPTAGALPYEWEWITAPESGGQGPFYGAGGGNMKQVTPAGAVIANWTAASGTLPSGATMLVYHGNRVWAAGMSSYGGLADPESALVSSDLGDPRAWPAANVIQFAPGDGEAITAIARLGPYLVVFKRSRAWLIYDLDTGANRPLGENVGCIAHRSAVETPEGLVFLSPENGFMRTSGSGAVPISRNLQPLIDEMEAAGVLESCHAGYIGERYVAAFEHPATYTIAGRSEQATILVYDFPTESWWKQSGRSSRLVSAVAPIFPGNELETRLYAGCLTGRQVDRLMDGSGTGKADGTSLDSLYTIPYLPTGPVRARITGAILHGSGAMGVRVSKDYSGALVRDVAPAALVAAGDDGSVGLRLMDLGVAEALRFQVYNESATDMRLEDLSVWTSGRRD